jgi:hypothetical protein
MTTHSLKTWPGPFAAVLSGEKTHEVRKNDRGYAVGDRLELREWVPLPDDEQSAAPYHWGPDVSPRFTGRSILVEVTHLTADSWGLPSGLVVMSIRKVGV